MHYRDSSVSPEAIKWRQDLACPWLEGRRWRVYGAVSGVTSGQWAVPADRLSADTRPACNVSGNRDPDVFFFLKYVSFSSGKRW